MMHKMEEKIEETRRILRFTNLCIGGVIEVPSVKGRFAESFRKENFQFCQLTGGLNC